MNRTKIVLIFAVVMVALVAGSIQAQDDDVATVGIVAFQPMYQQMIDSFIEAMAGLGYVVGENITYVYEGFPGDDLEIQRETAQMIIDAEVDVILAVNEQEAVLVRELTDTVPIVFGMSNDPVTVGLVEDLTEPGGNATGIVVLPGITGRRLQLLWEICPTLERIYVPLTAENTTGEAQLAELAMIAEPLEIELVVEEIGDMESLLEAIATLPEDIDAIFLLSGDRLSQRASLPWFGASVRHRAGLSIEVYGRVPGVLMGYGPSTLGNTRQAARMVNQILNGADPAQIPVQNAESALMINLEVAHGLGIDIPRAALRQAELIIRAGDIDDSAIETWHGIEATAEPDAAGDSD